MKRIVSPFVIASALAFALALGVAGQSFAGGDMDCKMMKDGTAPTVMGESPAACLKWGGKLDDAKAAAKAAPPAVPSTPAVPKAPSKPSVPNPMGN
jgi:hypothetical protein